MYLTNSIDRKMMKLLLKQYTITNFELAGNDGFFNIEDGSYEKDYGCTFENRIIRIPDPQYKLNYIDIDGNEFYWLLSTNELNINN
jgi:hypothetical protein